MKIIKAACPICGDVELIPEQVEVTDNRISQEARYSFTCPKCGDVVTKDAGPVVQGVLRPAGVKWNVIEAPAEALELKDGPPITLDDLIDLARDLEKL